jgi:hypothetical protein
MIDGSVTDINLNDFTQVRQVRLGRLRIIFKMFIRVILIMFLIMCGTCEYMFNDLSWILMISTYTNYSAQAQAPGPSGQHIYHQAQAPGPSGQPYHHPVA